MWEDMIMKGNTSYGFQFYYVQGYFTFRLQIGSYQALPSTTIPLPDLWYHVVGTYDGQYQKIFINGILENEQELSGTITNNNEPLSIGYKVAGDNSYLNGNSDKIRIYDRALSEEDISELYSQEMNGITNLQTEGLVGYWKFNAGEGDILYDHSGNGNHGTIHGATWSTELDLNDGNNLMSFPGGPQITSTEALLSSMGDTINFIIGQGVGLFNNNPWSGNLNNVDKYSGYWMNLDEGLPFDYLLDGESVISPPVEYNITGGNNLVSYLGKDGCATIDALNDEDNFNFIIGQGVGLFNNEGDWSGNLNNLYRANGYWMNAIEADPTFTWGECSANTLSKSEPFSNIPEDLRFIQSTEQAFYLIKDIHIDGQEPQQGDILLAYNNNILVGSVEYDGAYTPIPVMGRDISPQTEGFCEVGDTPSIKLFKAETGDIIDLSGNLEGWSSLGVYTVESLTGSTIEIPIEYVLHPAYPNPFNPVTTISYGLPQDSKIALNVYDIEGRMVTSLTSGVIKAGNHTLEWNADNLPSGVYFVKMRVGDFNHTQKLMLIK